MVKFLKCQASLQAERMINSCKDKSQLLAFMPRINLNLWILFPAICDSVVTSSRSVTAFVTHYFAGLQQITLECDEVTRFSALSCPRARL